MDKFGLYLVLAMLGALIAGCSSNNNPTSASAVVTDQQAVTQIATTTDSVAQFLSSEEATINDGGLQLVGVGGNAIPAEIKFDRELYHTSSIADSVVEWGRVINVNQIVREYTVVVVGDSIAYVTITKTVPGDFEVAWGTRPTSDSVVIDTVIHKLFTQVIKRRVELKRIARNADPLRNWTLVAITFVTGKTVGSVTFGIDSLEITDNHVGYDSTYGSPLQSWFRFGRYRESIPIFYAGDTVTVRLTVSGSDSLPEIVILRHDVDGSGFLSPRLHMSMISQTGVSGNHTRTFQRSFIPRLPQGALIARFNALADVFPNRCLYSKTAAYENELWGLPYIVIQ